MHSTIRRCANWTQVHDRPVYTLLDQCPSCDGPTENSAPPPFDPVDRYGAYRRRIQSRE